MDSSKEANGQVKPSEDASLEQYSAVPPGGGDRIQLIPNQGADRASGSSVESGTEVSPLQMELGKQQSGCQAEGLKVIIISAVSFSAAISVALIMTIYFGPPQVEPHGAVSCDSETCAEVGAQILRIGGSSVDAAIAAAFCLGVVNPFSAGIGGGGFMIMRDNRNNETLVIDARETAPLRIEEVYHSSNYESNVKEGGASVAVPGLLRGLEVAHKKYGKLKWADLVKPSIEIATKIGFNVSSTFINSLGGLEKSAEHHVALHEFLLQLGRSPMEQDTFYNKDLGKTLKTIAEKGPSAFYTGDIAQSIVREIENKGGVVSMEDMANYEALQQKPIETNFKHVRIQTVGPPAGGAYLLMMLNIMGALHKRAGNHSVDAQWFVEAQKYSRVEYGHLGDPQFEGSVHNLTDKIISKLFAEKLANETDAENTHDAQWYEDKVKNSLYNFNIPDSNNSAVTVVGPDEHMVALSMSLGKPWGSLVMAPGTGVILNSQIASFTSSSTNEYNRAEAGKRPASYMAPTLVFNPRKPCDIRMAVGGGGGRRIPAGVTEVINHVIAHNKSLSVAINDSRMYARVQTKTVEYERALNGSSLNQEVVSYLRVVGNEMVEVPNINSTVNAASKINETVDAFGDKRNGGGQVIF